MFRTIPLNSVAPSSVQPAECSPGRQPALAERGALARNRPAVSRWSA
ncbi:hypothetical protein Ga0074812_104237 [Parafrankia irregularis]|uniref:Uncharacterized protein n=2 Tax=Frankiaceae TaxID=74712 RepID=A0A0S4QIF9_9ACTN|nr:hypothetical protein Ga0074812_104237 [Parafrankia irregularis]